MPTLPQPIGSPNPTGPAAKAFQILKSKEEVFAPMLAAPAQVAASTTAFQAKVAQQEMGTPVTTFVKAELKKLTTMKPSITGTVKGLRTFTLASFILAIKYGGAFGAISFSKAALNKHTSLSEDTSKKVSTVFGTCAAGIGLASYESYLANPNADVKTLARTARTAIPMTTARELLYYTLLLFGADQFSIQIQNITNCSDTIAKTSGNITTSGVLAVTSNPIDRVITLQRYFDAKAIPRNATKEFFELSPIEMVVFGRKGLTGRAIYCLAVVCSIKPAIDAIKRLINGIDLSGDSHGRPYLNE